MRRKKRDLGQARWRRRRVGAFRAEERLDLSMHACIKRIKCRVGVNGLGALEWCLPDTLACAVCC